jgi:hypothetical protein
VSDNPTGAVVVLRGHLTARLLIAGAILSAPAILWFLIFSVEPLTLPSLKVLNTVISVFCFAMALRWLAMRVELSPTSLRAVGWFTQKDIPRGAIIELGGGADFTFVAWVDATGRRKVTRLDSLASRSSIWTPFWRAEVARREVLRSWIDGDSPTGGQI